MPKHPISGLLTEYDGAYQRRFNVPAPIVRGKDQKLAKQLLDRYSLEQLTGWLQTFFTMRDPFVQQSGYTFGVFVACIGKVIAAHEQPDRRDDRLQGLRDFVNG